MLYQYLGVCERPSSTKYRPVRWVVFRLLRYDKDQVCEYHGMCSSTYSGLTSNSLRKNIGKKKRRKW